MKKVLCLSLLTCSIFSMQLSTIKNKAKIVHEKLVKFHSSEPNESKKSNQLDKNSTQLDILKQHESAKQPIQKSSFYASPQLGKVKVYHNDNGFYVNHDDKMHYVQRVFTDLIVRKVTTLEMKDFQRAAKGYLHIKQMANGQFEIKVEDRLRGGGPILGVTMYWITKVLCYATGVVAVSASVSTVVPAVVGAVGAIAGGTGAATMVAGATTTIAGAVTEGAIIGVAGASSLTAGAVAGTMAATGTAVTAVATGTAAATGATIIGTTAGALTAGPVIAGTISTATGLAAVGSAGATIGGATIGGMAVGEVATLATTAVVGHATSTAGAVGGATLIVGGIEAFAATVGTFFGMLPTP